MEKNSNKKEGADLKKPVSDDSMERLAKLMNDSPTILKLKDTEWQINALKPGTQWLISEEACKVIKQENASMGDVFKGIALEMPLVVRILTLALLNDKSRIESVEYQKVYDQLMWGQDMQDWANLLLEVLNLIDVSFFFATTELVEMFRQSSLARKMTTAEAKESSPARNTAK